MCDLEVLPTPQMTKDQPEMASRHHKLFYVVPNPMLFLGNSQAERSRHRNDGTFGHQIVIRQRMSPPYLDTEAVNSQI
jgi:hypothetical protein